MQLLALDGVTPLAGYPVTVDGPSNQVILSACNYGTCVLSTNAQGIVTTEVTPLVTGTIPLNAVYTPLVAAASITGVAASDSLSVLTQPGGPAIYPGAFAGFRVQLLGPDGSTPDAEQNVTFAVTQGSLSFSGCAAAACSVVTDAQGIASLTGITGAAGPVTVTASFGNLAQAMSFTISAPPRVLQLVSVPASGAYVGSAAAVPFAVRVLQSDGVTAVVNENVTLSVANGSASLAACGGASICTLPTDASGMAASAVTPLATGTVGLTAVDGALSQSGSFTAVARPDVLQVVSAPANGALVGDAAPAALSVRVLAGDGVTPLMGRAIMLSVTSGSASLQACGGSTCALVSDANGLVSSAVTPLAAGSITLLASEGSIAQSVVFTAADKPKTLQLLSAPAPGAYVGKAARSPFAVQVVLGSGAFASSGENITVSVTNGSAALGACAGASSCTLATDASGRISTTVTPGAAGTVTLLAVDGSASVSASFTANSQPDLLQVVSAPANGALVGNAAALPFTLKVLAADGVTAQAGKAIAFSVTAGSATLGACTQSACTLTSDTNGLVSTLVTPAAAGAVTLMAADGAVTQSVSFVAAAKPDVLRVVSAPASGAFVGSLASPPFSVQVLRGDGTGPEATTTVTFTVTNGSAVFAACNGGSSCALATDASGMVSSGVTPLLAGTITLMAADGTITQAVSFNTLSRPDVLSVVNAPANGAWVGVAASQAFTVRLTQADGVTADAGKTVVLAGNNVGLAACGAAACSLVTDANGLVSTAVTPLQAGSITLSATAGALQQSVSFTAGDRPDTVTVQTVPADGSEVGSVAAVPFAVQVLAGDGSPGVGRPVTLTVTNGTLAVCGAAVCVLAADTQGVVRSGVTPQNAGTVALQASDGSVSVSASFLAKAKPDALTVTSAPADGSLVGDVAALPFTVRVNAGDGAAGIGRNVTVNVTNGTLVACSAVSCVLTSDANGIISSGVIPAAAGTVNLSASEASVIVMASFTASAKPDMIVIAAAPPAEAYVGDTVAAKLRVLLADGVTPAAGKAVLFVPSGAVSGSGSAILGGCTGTPCTAVADSAGYVAITLTAVAEGTVTVAVYEPAWGSNTAELSFAARGKPDSMVLVSAPAGSGLVGDPMAVAFAARVLEGDGVTAAVDRTVTFTVSLGSASFGACGESVCRVRTDANGVASTTVTPLAPASVTIAAAEENNSLSASFSAAVKPDLLQVSSTPGATVHLGARAAAPFMVRLVQADGTTPVAGVAITFSIAGRGAGTVQFDLCGAASCVATTDASGFASTTVTGTAAGALTLLAMADTTTGAGNVSLAFQVVANDDSLNALDAVTYVAEGVLVQATLEASATSNGAAAAGVPVVWTGSAGVALEHVESTTAADGTVSAEVALGPLAGGAAAGARACAWGNVCADFTVVGTTQAHLQVVLTSGGQQAVTGGAAPAPVQAWVSDGAGHSVAGAAVTVYQTVTALTLDCPSQGRCPAQPVLASKVTVTTTDANGLVSVAPLVVTGSATSTQMAFSVGSAGFATAKVTSRP